MEDPRFGVDISDPHDLSAKLDYAMTGLREVAAPLLLQPDFVALRAFFSLLALASITANNAIGFSLAGDHDSAHGCYAELCALIDNAQEHALSLGRALNGNEMLGALAWVESLAKPPGGGQ